MIYMRKDQVQGQKKELMARSVSENNGPRWNQPLDE